MRSTGQLRLALMTSAFITASLCAAPTLAQQAAETEQASNVDDVVVTARRREESLKDVPVAVTAVTSERLEQTGAADITTLQAQTPNATVQVARGTNSTLTTFIRGVGQQDPLWGFEPGVGLYVDDIYVARPQGAVLDIFDIERLEVLRGPQGTLYGRNTIGGAIKYVTKRLGPDPELTLKGAYGSYNQVDLIASGSAPITETLRIGGAIARYTRDGYGTNLNTGAEHYNKDVTAGRLSVEWTPRDNLFFRLAGDITEDESNARHGYRLKAPTTDDVYDTRAGIGDDGYVRTRGLSLTGEWNVNDAVTLKSVTAWRDGDTKGDGIDFDGLPQPILDIPGYYADSQFTQEFQLLFQGERWQGVAGVFYMDASAEGAFDTVIGLYPSMGPGLPAGLTTFTGGKVDTESFAVFADFSYDVTDQLSLSVGGRWTRDKKSVDQLRQNYLGIKSPFFGNSSAIPAGPPSTDYTNSDTYSEFTPRVSASYKFTPELTGYASYGRGFKSGGFDMRGDASLYPETVNGYQPELVDTYEIGLKGSLLDRRINFATALFKSEYTDQQITSQFFIPPTSVVSYVDNAGSSEIWGWELEASARITDSFIPRLTLGYLDAKFNDFVTLNPDTGKRENMADQRHFQNTPDWTASLALPYSFDLGDRGSVIFTPTAAYRGATQMFETPIPLLDQGSYWLYDATLMWTSPDARYRVSLAGRNLGDERYRAGGYNFPGAITGDSVIGFYGPPRTVTLSVTARF
ncbi:MULTISPECIES: TonB-dependent receptor [Brevundimonas]|uniref:TonB-dependent receptor n=2 Tax=Brevundimonas TaxID=41275 RepID=A0A1Z3M018_BREDI|nr:MULTISPECIES: TonB-dependent receptor [Brevundimonas]ASD27793.1 TonB-dependent receptor [Brevundimonas diminuta]VTO16941.1 Colicin I receptor precursor [Brevundimonas vancanneytii]